MRKFWNGVLIFLLAGGIFWLAGTTAGVVWLGTQFASEFPDEYLSCGEVNRPSFLYASDGDRQDLSSFQPIAELRGSTVSIPVTLDEVPENLRDAFVAIEDKRFFEHRGVDWLRTAEAAMGYLFGSGDFGASTITQQLVKNLTGNDAHTPMRKLQELFYATDLEEKTDKSEILERYLNIINLSGGCTGVGAAAQRYYSVPVSELTLSRCASIAAITKNPSRYDPLRHPEQNLRRRNVILDEMCRQGYITEAERDAAKAEGLDLCPTSLTGDEPINSWYTDTVIEDVLADLSRVYGYSSAAASRMLYYGGLRIYTAMDPEIQQLLEEYYADSSHFPACADGKIPQSAAVVIDPFTGDLLAVAGAHGEKTGNRIQNLATQAKRPPASALKPLSVYAPALKLGKITWASVYDDVPVEFRASGGGFRPWPKNADGIWRGLTGIPQAISHSINTVAVRVLRDIGKEASVEFLTEELGFSEFSSEDGEAALALGQTAYGVTLRELTAAYTVFADGGYRHPARSYYLVTDEQGGVLLSSGDSPRRVLSEEQAAVMTKLLEGVTATGTAKALTLTQRTAVAGKTGTSSSEFDRWFIGYTPKYLCGVWYGFEYPEVTASADGNPAVSVWDGFMNLLYDRLPPKLGETAFSVPDTLLELSFCADSGDLPTEICQADPRGHRERVGWFVPGTEPSGFCHTHTEAFVDPLNGGIRQDGEGRCVGLLNLVRSFPKQIYVLDAPYTTRALPDGTPFCTEPDQPFFAYALKEGEYAGIGYGNRQYNRGCPPTIPDTGTPPEETAPGGMETQSKSQTETGTETETEGNSRTSPFPPGRETERETLPDAPEPPRPLEHPFFRREEGRLPSFLLRKRRVGA